VSYRFDCTVASARDRGITRATQTVQDGGLVVLPVDTVYGLGCDAFSPTAVDALRTLKGHRRDQPPPVLIAHARTLDGIATDLTPAVRELTTAFWPGPLTLICRAQPTLSWDLGDSFGTVAVRVPLHPLALELLEKTGPMAITGAGSPSNPNPVVCEDVRTALGEAVECYLDAGVLTRTGASTIVDVSGYTPRVVRVGGVSFAQLREVVPDIAQ
jgi:tRNA threonylcarbamoyl adenosine modification protein (Sua5/YciO/YrdC/YwlC family)